MAAKFSYFKIRREINNCKAWKDIFYIIYLKYNSFHDHFLIDFLKIYSFLGATLVVGNSEVT